MGSGLEGWEGGRREETTLHKVFHHLHSHTITTHGTAPNQDYLVKDRLANIAIMYIII